MTNGQFSRLSDELFQKFSDEEFLRRIAESKRVQYEYSESISHDEFIAGLATKSIVVRDASMGYSHWLSRRQSNLFSLLFFAYFVVPPLAAFGIAVATHSWIPLLYLVVWRLSLKLSGDYAREQNVGCAPLSLVVLSVLAIWLGPVNEWTKAMALATWTAVFYQIADIYGQTIMIRSLKSNQLLYNDALASGAIKIAAPLS